MAIKPDMWGQHLVLDISGCPIEKIGNGDNILAWVKELVTAIDMVAYGEPILEHFATHKKETAGYSLIQLIETSNIAAHFAEMIGQVYIDIFSCKEFDEQIAIDVCKKYFEPTRVRIKNFERGDFFNEYLPGCREFQSLPVDEIIYEGQTAFQEVAIYRSREQGRMLILDKIVQTAESDEFIYHEMMVHVPLFSHPNPKRVLIVGGGDGGILREVLKHKVDHIDMVEIDGDVINLCNKYMSSLNDAGKIYEDKRVKLTIGDAFPFLENHKGEGYDVIIVDSTDPAGPGEVLYGQKFYEYCERALNPGGIVTTQNGVLSDKNPTNLSATHTMQKAKLAANCYLISVPTYYGGPMALGYAVKQNPANGVPMPTLAELQSRFKAADFETQNYSPEIHLAAFVLPNWVKKMLK